MSLKITRTTVFVAALAGLAVAGCEYSDENDVDVPEISEAAEDLRREADEGSAELAGAISEAVQDVADAISESVQELAEEIQASLPAIIEDLYALPFEWSDSLLGEKLVEEAVDPVDLYDLLPDELGKLDRLDRNRERVGLAGYTLAIATATYSGPGRTDLEVVVVDVGALPLHGPDGVIGEFGQELDERDGQGWARSITYRGHPGYMRFKPRRGSDGGQGDVEFAILVEGRFLVLMEADAVTVEEFEGIRDGFDVAQLEEMRN